MFLRKPARKYLISLNLTALIDVTALIIIFLIMGSIFGESSIVIPNPLQIPKSENKELVEAAPQIILLQKEVQVSFVNQKIPLANFEDSEKLKSLKQMVQAYIRDMPERSKKSGALLNVIADKKKPYKELFDVIRFFREAGFQSILFVAQGE